MKTKLRNPRSMSSMNLATYHRKLKTDFTNLKAASEDGPVSFVFFSEFQFEDEVGPLLVIGLSNVWKMFIREQRWLKLPENKKTLVGLCIRKGEEMELQIQKGKLKPTFFRRAIKKSKVLKRFEWEIVEDFSLGGAEDDLDQLSTDEREEQSFSAAERQEHERKAKAIGRELIGLVRKLQAAEAASEKKALMLQIDQDAEQLYAIPDWEDYTDDRLEKALEQIDDALEGQQDTTTQDQATAEKIVGEMKSVIKNIKSAKGLEKQEFMGELDGLRDELDNIPKWRDYTPDNIEKILAQVEEALLELKTTAEEIVEEMKSVIKNIKSADGSEKEPFMQELVQLHDRLDNISQWRDYTPDSIERILEQVAEALGEAKAKEAETETKVQQREGSYLNKAQQLRATLYEELKSFKQSKIVEQISAIQTLLDEWKAFEQKVMTKPRIADALRNQQALAELLEEVKGMATILTTIEPDMTAFQEAIQSKDRVKALELKEQLKAALA